MSLDVVEMDAASNNSVDDIRELRENVALAPMQGGKRVYILDEAHMLTTAAWNAFLKTLEEPPQHVVFVLATTEAHKVPPTIIDRCHRFDFQRPSLEQIAGVLKRVADEEGIQIPDAAVGMLARAATGSFRDALGTLEQLVTYGGNEVKLDDVLEILGVADAELVLAAGEALADRDPRAALLTVQSLSESGRDFTQFMRDLSAHLRHLFVVQTLGHVPDSFSVTAEQIDFLAAAIAAVKDGSEPRIQLEMALLKATQPQADLSLQALMFRIDQLEEAVGKSDAAAPGADGSSSAALDPPKPAPRTQRQAPKGASAAAVAPQVDESPQPMGSVQLDQIVALWPAVSETVAEQNGMLSAALSAATPTALDGDRLTIAFPADAAFVKKKAEQGRDLVANAVRGITGHPLTLAFELSDAVAPPAGPATLDHDQLIERLRAEFGAEEVFDEPDEERD
jgi:DNA polymerase-3 subunit gamma/tau